MNRYSSMIFLVLMTGFLLTGCDAISLKNLSPKYAFKKKTYYGVGALSVRCNLGNEKTYLYLSRKDKIYKTSFHCNSPKQALSAADLKLFQLPSGTYIINNWAQIRDYKFFIDKKTGRTFNPISFKIMPRQVSYIGQLQLIAQSGQNYQMQLINEEKKDLPKIRNNLPSIPVQDIHIRLGMVSPKQMIYSH